MTFSVTFGKVPRLGSVAAKLVGKGTTPQSERPMGFAVIARLGNESRDEATREQSRKGDAVCYRA